MGVRFIIPQLDDESQTTLATFIHGSVLSAGDAGFDMKILILTVGILSFPVTASRLNSFPKNVL